MPSTFTTNLNLEKPGIGEQDGDWGATLNSNFDGLDTAIASKVSASEAATLTNKGIDADNNSISNLEVDNLKSGVLDTDLSSVSASDDTLASAKSIKAYVDSQSSSTIASDTLTFTNKTFDVEGTGNSISNIDVADLKSGVLDTDISSVSASDDTLASAKAIKTYVDAQVATKDTLAELSDTSISSPAAGHLLIYDNTQSHFENATLTEGANISITNADGQITIASTDTNTQLSQEQVEDFVGGMLDGTETFIDVSYDDTDGNIDFVVPVKDEDNFTSNSDTHLATQQSIKAYVDANSGGGGVTRNYINNPEFSVHQRSTTINATTLGTQNDDGSYTLDQWVLLSDGDDIVDILATESDSPTGSKKAMELDVETANKKFGIVQFIENVNCESIIGQEVTLSFQAKATSALEIRAAIIAWDGTEDAPTKDIVSSWESEGTNPTLVSNMTYENTPSDLNVTSTYAKYSVTATIDTSGTKNVAVFIWSNVTSTTANTDKLHIGQVQLEKGSSASDFVFESYTDHVQRCQRYFQGYNVDAAGIGTSAIFTSVGHAFTTASRFRTVLVTPMRVGPTQTFAALNLIGKTNVAVTSSTYSARTTDENVTSIGGNYNYSTTSTFNSPSGLNGAAQVFTFLNTIGFCQFSAELGV